MKRGVLYFAAKNYLHRIMPSIQYVHISNKRRFNCMYIIVYVVQCKRESHVSCWVWVQTNKNRSFKFGARGPPPQTNVCKHSFMVTFWCPKWCTLTSFPWLPIVANICSPAEHHLGGIKVQIPLHGWTKLWYVRHVRVLHNLVWQFTLRHMEFFETTKVQRHRSMLLHTCTMPALYTNRLVMMYCKSESADSDIHKALSKHQH